MLPKAPRRSKQSPPSRLKTTRRKAAAQAEDRKQYGIPRYIRLADGRMIDTRTSTVPKNLIFACGKCGHPQDFRTSVQEYERSAPMAPYAIQGYCPTCDAEGHIYSGRFFAHVDRDGFAPTEFGRSRVGTPTRQRPGCILAARRRFLTPT